MKVYRVTVTRTLEQEIYVLAAGRAAARDAALDEIDLNWEFVADGDDEVVGVNDGVDVDEVDPAEHLYGADMTIGEWVAQQDAAEQDRLEREATPGTAEYQAAREAEGQLRLDQMGGVA